MYILSAFVVLDGSRASPSVTADSPGRLSAGSPGRVNSLV